ncbi:MAG: AMP-binding protein, partial [Lachnospiraceae bacterium]|nr:AMP-binding protein [Lachnospiraceae bacterium]
IEEAVNEVLKANPGVNVYLKNGGYFASEKKVSIREYKVSDDDLFNNDLFREPIDYMDHSVEICVIENRGIKYLLFRIMHSVLDGKASLVFIQNIMNYLRKEELIPSTDNMRDADFIKNLGCYSKKESKIPKIIISDSNKIKNYRIRWKTLEIEGYPTAITAKVSRILADLSPDKCGRIMVPVDLRRHAKGMEYNCNLTLPIILNVNEDEAFEDINGDLLNQMRENKELNIANAEYFNYDRLPAVLRKTVLRALLSMAKNGNKYSLSGIASSIGRVDLKLYDNPYIEFEEFISLPIQQPLVPFSVVYTQYDNKTMITVSYFEGQFSEEKTEEFCRKIEKVLSPDLYEFNDTKVPVNENMFEVIFDNLKTLGDKCAVREEKDYSYSELYRNVCRITTLLKEKNITGDLCICIDRSFSYLSAILACVFNEITYMPIDRSKSASDINTILNMSASGKILIDEEIEGVDKEACIFVSEAGGKEEADLSFKADPEKEVYRIFTSGTTNVPKCAPIRHKNINNFLAWSRAEFGKNGEVNMPLFTSLSVDLTVTATLVPLLCKGFVRAYPGPFRADIFNKIVREKELNVIKCTPTHFAFLDDKEINIDKPKTFIIGGEILSGELVSRIFERFGKETKIYNEYGPTEATVGVIAYICSFDDKNTEVNIPIGTPIFNTKILLQNTETKEIIKAENETGEMLIGGESVFDGYKNTDADCFEIIDGEKYYRSGDLAFVRNGIIHCLGRADNQVKINGNRVELEYIRHCINGSEKVEDCVVVYKNNLCAFVVSKDKDEAAIRDYLVKTVPSYMIPQKIVFIDEIPLAKSGKTDTAFLIRKMEEMKEENFAGKEESESPLYKILYEFYKSGPVKADDNLYAIGMESIELLMFIEKIKDTYISEENEDAFFMEVLPKADEMTIADMERIIVKFGGKI